MSTARRGITDHALVETIESVYIAADPDILARREIDRLAVVFAMMRDPRCTALEAIGAADRLFPLPPTKGEDDATVEGHS